MNPIPCEFIAKDILISRIDWTDTTFRITYNRSLGPLIHSIETIGLQNPPVLQEIEGDRFRIVAGWRRLRAIEKIGRKSVSCKIASIEAAEKDLFLFNFHENIDRGFNPVEQSWAVKKLSAFIEEGKLVKDYLPWLNLPSKGEMVPRYLTTSEISPIYWPALFLGRLFPETIEMVFRDFRPLADPVFALFIFLHWGFQKQKEFLSDLREIGKRRSEDPESFFFSEPVANLLRQSTWTPQKKGEALRKLIRVCLFPTLTKVEKAFSETIFHLNLDQRTRISPPPFFEGGRYGLEVQFSNPKELKESLEKISHAVKEGKLDDLP